MWKSDNNCSISLAFVSRGAKYFFGSMLSRPSFRHSLKKALFWKQHRRYHSITEQSWCRAVALKQGSDYRCHLARECLLPTTKTKAQCWVKIGRACNNAARNRIETGLSYSLERVTPTCLPCRSTGVAWNAKFSPWTLPLLPVPLPPQENCALVDKKRTVDWHFRLAPIRLIPIVRRPCQNQIWEHHNRILIPLLWILNNTYSIFTRFFVAYARKAHHGQRKYFLKRHRRLLRFKTAILYIFSSISIDLPWTSRDLLYYGNICRSFSLLIEHLQNYMSDLYFSGSVKLSLRCRTNLNLYSLSRFFHYELLEN